LLGAGRVFSDLFDQSDFPARWHCGLWTAAHGWTHIIADVAIFGAYAAIPASIAYFLMKKREVQLPALWWLFAAFIASCGFGHLVEATIFWHPWYRFSALVKVITALVSWGAVLSLFRYIPHLLSLPGIHNLNSQLRSEVEQRKRTEAERERFFDLSLDMLCTANFEGYFVRLNPAFHSTLGYTREELQTIPFIQLVHPDDIAHTQHEMEKLTQGEACLRLENRYRAKDGSWHWLAWKAMPDMETKVIYATARDVTDYRRVEHSLRLREQSARLQVAVGACLVKTQSLAESLQQCCEAIVRHLDAASARVWMLEPGEKELQLKANAGLALPTADPLAHVPVGETKVVEIAEKGIPFLTNRLRDDVAPENRAALEQDGLVAFAGYPLAAREVVNGVLAVLARRELDDDEWNTLELIAQEMSLTISRHRTQEALRKSEADARRLALVAARTNNGVIITDNAGLVEWVNEGFVRLSGFKLEEIRGHKPGRLLQGVKTDPTAVRVMREAIRRGTSFFTEVINYRKDGSEFCVAIEGQPLFDAAGKLTNFMAVETDITERQRAEKALRDLNATLEDRVEKRAAELIESEERFRLLVEQVQDYAIFILDPDGRVASWNRGAERTTGYTSTDIVGRPFAMFHPPHEDVLTATEKLLGEATRSGSAREEGLRMKKDGGTFWAEVVLTAITDPTGALRGYAVVIHDLTKRREVEAHSMRSQRLEAIGNLASGIAHDLNNALGPIVMGLNLLSDTYPKEGAIIETFLTCGKRASDMVRQLLTFARGAEGERVIVQPTHLLKEMQKIMQGTLPKNIQSVWGWPSDLHPINGDPTQIHQILLNLCVNARDAMPNGGTLTVEASNVEVDEVYASAQAGAQPGSYVRFDVRDTGDGIPAHIIDRIFDPFFTTKAPDKGTGLGLSTVMGIIKGHGGFIRVYSPPGDGATFCFFLPVSKDDVPAKTPESEQSTFSGQGEKILIVDDEQTIRDVSTRVLQRLNFHPITATDGADALIHIAESRQDLRAVVTDMHMPHMDGLGLVRAIRRVLPELPVIVASGRLEENERRELAKHQISGLLRKPFTQDEFAKVLKDVLGKSPQTVTAEQLQSF
jgi:PAS domain S-box-containing protein